MMRIAIAGGGGLGYLLATRLSEAANAYNVIVLSRTPRPEFRKLGVEVHPVDYGDSFALEFALQGVDLAVSTVSGKPQLSLINAAGRMRVSNFVPSEFERPLDGRPLDSDALQDSSTAALDLLKYWERATGMRYTVFSCGAFMEHFHPNGLAHLNIGHVSGVTSVGRYLVDIENNTAEYVPVDAKGRDSKVCLTSTLDWARFLVAALDLGPRGWPHEFTMRGDRLAVQEIVAACSLAFNVRLVHISHSLSGITSLLDKSSREGDADKVVYYRRLRATAQGRYDFVKASLNEELYKKGGPGFQPMKFDTWLNFTMQAMSAQGAGH